MAKGNFLTTVVRGKLGNMVGYKATNSKNKEKQAWRGYVASISNPKSLGQANQRMIMANLTRNYGSLQGIISRSFEGFKYGGQSYQHFLKLNAKLASNGPFIPKGSRSTPLPIPGLIMSEGSLISVAVNGVNNITAEGIRVASVLNTDLVCTLDLTNVSTWGAICANLKASNTDVQDGDQLTFVEVSVTENLEYIYRFKSLIIDSTSQMEAVHYTGRVPSAVVVDGVTLNVSDNCLQYSCVLPLIDEVAVAGTVIQSRLAQDGSWLRSPSVLWVNIEDDEIMQYFSQEMYELTLQSYMNGKSTRAVDWPTEPDEEVVQTWKKVRQRLNVTHDGHNLSFSGLAIASSSGEKKLVVTTIDGVEYCTGYYGDVAKYEGDMLPASEITGDEASLPKIDITDLPEYGL